MIKYNYATISNEGIISFTNEKNITKRFENNNFYVDKNAFDIVIADPVQCIMYELKNIYLINGGHIYIAGFAAHIMERKPDNKIVYSEAQAMNCWVNFTPETFEENAYKIKFNPNSFSQVDMFENLFTIDGRNHIYKNYVEGVELYEQPNSFIQKAIFLQGVQQALANKTKPKHGEINKIENQLNIKSKKVKGGIYFSLENYFVEGMRAVARTYYDKEWPTKEVK